jgi:hypothetical protein
MVAAVATARGFCRKALKATKSAPASGFIWGNPGFMVVPSVAKASAKARAPGDQARTMSDSGRRATEETQMANVAALAILIFLLSHGFLMIPVAAAANSDMDIGSWHFTSGKITLDVEGGPPPEYGSMISIKSTDSEDEAALFQISCDKKGYHLYLTYPSDPKSIETKKARLHIDIDNNWWIEGDAEISDWGKIGEEGHLMTATSNNSGRDLEALLQTRTALKITVTGNRPFRFLAHGTRDALLALHDAC